MQAFSFSFDELPLVIVGSVNAGLINGQAEIEYDRDGDWQIKSISIEGYLPLTLAERAAGKKPWVQVPAPVALATMVSYRLENEWSSKVQDAVSEQIAEDRECAADNEADLRREERMLERV